MNRSHIWMIHGPTASGKTRMAIEWAKERDCEILSCDARQIYKELNIGVARPSLEELKEVHHIGIGSHTIHKPATAVSFAAWAKEYIESSLKKNGEIVIVGGSGLYAKSILFKSDSLPAENIDLRKKLEIQWKLDPNILIKELIKLDPIYAENCDLKNSRRVIRALEIISISGKKYSSQRTQGKLEPNFKASIHQYAIWPEMNALESRISSRTQSMFDSGLVKEVKSLAPYKDLRALQTVGYKEFYSNPEASRIDLIKSITLHTRQYAKRQITWLKQQTDLKKILPESNAKTEIENSKY